MKQKTIDFFPKVVLSKEILSIWPRRADSGQNLNNLFSIREIWQFSKQYRNVYSSFLTLLVPVVAVREAVPISGPTGRGTQNGFPKSCTSGVSKIKNKLVVHGGVPVVAVGQAVPVFGLT
jgi:hypothetical protein